ncbi:aldehyde dehydrogenase family protein [Mycobacterium sp. 1274756.6]|uniref:aldehyde dehydrogenase family protein n=1 Tax=Mycobacterium sp. 1274756.6 TaxID=1834076 RepID=UPI0007FCDB64|nr:aldehyde dehydrogenase family protein [Mycobacterium sp. 1274756.6]OBJ71988.1 aldehyde dehydrogenase [Mycobacterium sp. 1274756.6]
MAQEPRMSAETGAVDLALSELADGERRWASLALGQRRRLLDEMRALTLRHADDWVATASRIKRLDPRAPLVGEEWLTGPYVLAAALRDLAGSLENLAKGISPLDKAGFGTRAGRTTIKVLPTGTFDTLLLNGFSADVWLRPGVDEADARDRAGLAQRTPAVTGGIGAVLGAGNITSIAPLDALYELIAHNRVVAVKLNPLTDPLLPVFNNIFAPLIDLGAIRFLTGDADVGGYLVRHQLVSHVHMTGSAATHDAIVWGQDADAAVRKRQNNPLLSKDVTSELGGVSPTIVLPGRWSQRDLTFQAEHIATQRLHNGGYNCVAAQAVILSADWGQKDQFLTALRKAVHNAPQRAAYYPGSDQRVARARTAYPDAEQLGARGERLLITGIKPDSNEPLLDNETFSPVLGVVEISGSERKFAHAAVNAANTAYSGTLGVNVIAHPRTIRNLGDTFDSIVAELRYGTVAINAWTGLGYLTPTASWGAFPGHTLADVQSGIGIVHNAWLIDDVERTVVRGPFRPAPRSLLRGELALSPKPPWFVNNRTAASTGRLLTSFAADPRWGRLPKIFLSALRG